MGLRKFIVRIEIEHEVAAALGKLCNQRGSLISRAVKWLGRQDAEIQTDHADGAVASTMLKKLVDSADGRLKKKG
jgi:hypothetical protein